MTPRDIRDQINNGDVPSFKDINTAFPGHSGISWHIRMAAQGSLPDAILVTNTLLGPKAQWWVGYDCRATVKVDGWIKSARQAISVTPGHALILATLDAFIAKGA